jgi:hypothetical protein
VFIIINFGAFTSTIVAFWFDFDRLKAAFAATLFARYHPENQGTGQLCRSGL